MCQCFAIPHRTQLRPFRLTHLQPRRLHQIAWMIDWHGAALALHTVEVASIAVLIESFANARLAREEHLRVETRLAAARRTGAPVATTRALAAEAACLQVRADNLAAHAEKLLPKMHAPAVAGDTTATLMQ